MEPVECKSVQKSSRLGGFLIYRFQFKILGIRSGNSASTPEPGRLEFLLVIFRDEILRRREGLEDDECVKFLSFLLVTSSRRQIESASVKRMMTAGLVNGFWEFHRRLKNFSFAENVEYSRKKK